MPAWLSRALVLAVLHGAGAVVLAQLKLSGVGSPTVLTWIIFALLIGVSLLWGSIDGWQRLQQPAQTWFVAGIVGGLVSGVLNVAGRALFVDQTGASALGVQLTSGAAFTALLIIVPAVLGVLVGSRLDAPPRAEPPAESPEPPAPLPDARRSSEKARARRARHRAMTPGRQAAAKPSPKPKPAAKPKPKPAATE